MEKINRKVINLIINQGLMSVDPENLIKKSVKIINNYLHIKDKIFNLRDFSRLHVLGVGKGVPFLYKGIKGILGDYIHGGIIVSIPENLPKPDSTERVTFIAGSHPLPDKKSLNAGILLYEYIQTNVGERDLVFFLLTGGASALIQRPVIGINYQNIVDLNQMLLSCGAEITEINCIRKHLSALKGGRMAQLIAPAKIVSLILSDIINSPLEDIGSGLSIGDTSTFNRAIEILKKYNIWSKISEDIRDYINKGIKKDILDTPRPDLEEFKANHHFLIGDNRIALNTVKKEAEKNNIPALILTSGDYGEASEVAKVYSAIITEIHQSNNPVKKPVLLIAGGELTVTLKGKGKGGRNQELVMHMLENLKDADYPFYILSIGSDGIDGSTDAAGAFIDQTTIQKVRALGLDLKTYINNNDSYHFFKELDQLIITGATKTNVMDLRLFYLP